ncbi:tail fiber domain-containing protein, partial [Candidatus Parcubacteria bacterium]|nr:tail fiber domain-containing protein [Candidatus Parcubacteria bacterium]
EGSIDTVNTAITGIGTSLINAAYAGTTQMNVDVNGNLGLTAGAKIYPLVGDSTAAIKFARAGPGNNVVVIDTTNSFVGIGINPSPNTALDVMGNIAASTSGNVDFILHSSTTTGGTNSDARFILRTGSTSERFDVINGAGTKLLTIASAGNIGVGTISPDGLQVNAGVTETADGTDNVRFGVLGGTPRVVLEDSGQTQWEIDNGAGKLRFFNPGVVRMTIQSTDGYVGIGTSGPTAQLHVVGANGTGGVTGTVGADGLTVTGGTGGSSSTGNGVQGGLVTLTGGTGGSASTGGSVGGAGGDIFFNGGTAGSGAGSDGRVGYVVLQGTNSGRVGIGDTTPDFGLDVVSDINSDDCFREAGVQVAGTCASDSRLKKNIQTLGGSLDKVLRLRPVTFEWKENNPEEIRYVPGRQVGLIAQEVEQVMPHLVKEKNGFLAVEYNLELQMMLIESIQELNNKIASLSVTVDQLASRSQSVQVSVSGTGVGQIASNGVDVLQTLASATLARVQSLWASGDMISEGIKKTYYAVASLSFPDLSVWGSREISVAADASDEVKSLFNGPSAQAADQSKVDLQENGNYLATYGVDSTRGEIQLSGTSQIINGEARVFFDYSFSSIISANTPIKVIITPTSTMSGQLYVDSKNQYGFITEELNGTDTGSFDWLVIARRKGFDSIITPTISPIPVPVVSIEPTPEPSISPIAETPELSPETTPTPEVPAPVQDEPAN